MGLAFGQFRVLQLGSFGEFRVLLGRGIWGSGLGFELFHLASVGGVWGSGFWFSVVSE